MAMHPDDLKLANGERAPRNQSRRSGGAMAVRPRDDHGRAMSGKRARTFSHEALDACLGAIGMKHVKP